MSDKVLGGGYTCSNCGKYHRTTTVCNCGDRKKLPEKKAEKIPTAEEFIQGYDMNFKDGKSPLVHMLKEFAKLHVQAALQAASEKVIANHQETWGQRTGEIEIDKDSILNAYSLTNIV